jgi:hypothetical protein
MDICFLGFFLRAVIPYSISNSNQKFICGLFQSDFTHNVVYNAVWNLI